MPAARHVWSAREGRTAHWPFAMPDAAPALPWIAPEFRSNLERILSTSRFYLQIEVGAAQRTGMRRRSRRR